MSHEVEHETTIYAEADGIAWHSLGRPISAEAANDPRKLAAECGALFNIIQRPIFIQLPGGELRAVPDRAALVRDDNYYVTGLASDTRYNVKYRQPIDIFESFRDQLAANRLSISHAAILGKGKRIAVCAKLPEDHSFSVGRADDRVDQYLTMITGYDAKTGTNRILSSIRVVCANTAAMAESDATARGNGRMRSISASQQLAADTLLRMVAGLAGDDVTANKASIGKETASVSGMVTRAARAARAQREAFNAMANKQISAIDLARYFGDVLEIDIAQLNQVDPQGRPMISTKSKNMLSALSAAYDSAPGSAWAHGNVWGALNAVTYYATHAKTCRDTSGAGAAAARYASNLDGDAAKLKARAMALAGQMVAVAA